MLLVPARSLGVYALHEHRFAGVESRVDDLLRSWEPIDVHLGQSGRLIDIVCRRDRTCSTSTPLAPMQDSYVESVGVNEVSPPLLGVRIADEDHELVVHVRELNRCAVLASGLATDVRDEHDPSRQQSMATGLNDPGHEAVDASCR